MRAESPFHDLRAIVEDLLRRSHAPGVSIAVVTPDETIAGGYGVRTAGGGSPVDDRTIFSIASAGKAFTATTIAMLVDEGRLAWDDRVTKYLPAFELYDPYVTRELTVRDLLCHRSGLARGDDLWYGGAYSRDEVLHRIRHLAPSWSFRSQFGYQNVMFVAAGEVVRAVTGTLWEKFVAQRIFEPLGMRATVPSVTFVDDFSNAMSAHAKRGGKVVEIPRYAWDTDAPAGGIYTNASDLTRWLKCNLGGGTFDGERLLGAAAHEELITPQTVIRNEPPWSLYFPEARFRCYGLGWFLSDYRGRKLVAHGGATDGMTSLVAFMPEESVGFAAAGNLMTTGLPYALLYHVLDAYLDERPRNRSLDIMHALDRRSDAIDARAAEIASTRIFHTHSTLPAAAYSGTYHNVLYGEAVVRCEDGGLVFSFVSYTGDLSHFHYDVFVARSRRPTRDDALLTFTVGKNGNPERLEFALPGETAITFIR